MALEALVKKLERGVPEISRRVPAVQKGIAKQVNQQVASVVERDLTELANHVQSHLEWPMQLVQLRKLVESVAPALESPTLNRDLKVLTAGESALESVLNHYWNSLQQLMRLAQQHATDGSVSGSEYSQWIDELHSINDDADDQTSRLASLYEEIAEKLSNGFLIFDGKPMEDGKLARIYDLGEQLNNGNEWDYFAFGDSWD